MYLPNVAVVFVREFVFSSVVDKNCTLLVGSTKIDYGRHCNVYSACNSTRRQLYRNHLCVFSATHFACQSKPETSPENDMFPNAHMIWLARYIFPTATAAQISLKSHTNMTYARMQKARLRLAASPITLHVREQKTITATPPAKPHMHKMQIRTHDRRERLRIERMCVSRFESIRTSIVSPFDRRFNVVVGHVKASQKRTNTHKHLAHM